jgi:hypothetical protein
VVLSILFRGMSRGSRKPSTSILSISFCCLLLLQADGRCHDQADAEWIVIRRPLRGHRVAETGENGENFPRTLRSKVGLRSKSLREKCSWSKVGFHLMSLYPLISLDWAMLQTAEKSVFLVFLYIFCFQVPKVSPSSEVRPSGQKYFSSKIGP